MSDNGNNNNVNTTGKDKQQRNQNKQQKNQNKQKSNVQKKAINAAKKIKALLSKARILVPLIIVVIVIISIIGAVGFLTGLPGTWIESVKEFGKNLWTDVTGFFTGDNITGKITEKEQLELAQHIQEMGYDIVGYGFADVKYEHDDDEDINPAEIEGELNKKIVGINKSIDGRNYLQAYIAQSEAIYVPSIWSVGGFFENTITNIKGFFTNNQMTETTNKNAKAYSAGMINIKGDYSNLSSIVSGPITNRLKPEIAINREEKILRIAMPSTITSRNVYYYSMQNWTSRYGKPLELFLSLHLSTMMPDLAYDLATEDAFNTKVNISLQRVTSTYKVIFDKFGDGKEPISHDEIEREYLKIMCGMTDQEINRFSDAGVLDDAFEKLLNGRGQYVDYLFNLRDGATVDTRGSHSTRIGTNLAEVENDLLGQKYSTYNITEIRTRTVLDAYQNPIQQVYTVEVVQDKILTCKDINIEDDKNNAQSELGSTVLTGITADQLEEFSKLILEGRKESITYLPRITTVDNHWYYSYVNFVYEKAGKAKKKVEYIPDDENNILSSTKLNGGKITLDQTYVDNTNAGGVYYQLCEPEVNGPNEAIKALFKGGSGTFNGASYNFSGKYYRYDGTRATALRIANAKANDKRESTFTFQNEKYDTASLDNEEWKIEKQDVTFATEDENGNKTYTDAFSAFAILENTHTEEAEWVYRNLKDLLVNLRYFSKENFTKPLYQVLLWPIERVGSDNIAGEDESVTEGIEREENEYGLFLREGKAFFPGETIIAPGDAVVQSIEGNTIKLKFKTISSEVSEELREKFGSDYKTVENELILDMEMTISGIKPSVNVGDTVSRGSKIGEAADEDIRIILYNIDKSLVEDIETYMYPEYEKTVEDDFNNGAPNSGQPQEGSGNIGGSTGTEGEGSYGNYAGEDFDPDYVFPSISERQNRVYRELRNLGCTKAGACAAMGNLEQESHFNPEAQNPDSSAYGLAQWTNTGGRKQRMLDWCTSHGYATNSFEGQLAYFLEEIQNVQMYKSAWNKMQTAQDDELLETTRVFSTVYEGYSGEIGKRQTYANAFMKQMAD